MSLVDLTNYMNTHENWEEELSKEPFCFKVNRDGEYLLVKYNIGTDFNTDLTHYARGVIFKEDRPSHYVCVCHPFDKFFNYGESYAASIDWDSAIVREKIDGSLIKVWYDNNEWHISTNGMVDAFKASVNETVSFGDLFLRAINNDYSFFDGLNINDIYMFELVSPENELVVKYNETALYYLGERNTDSDIESFNYTEHMKKYGIKNPRVYKLNNLDDVVNLVNMFGDDEEGCVVCDKNFNRIKVKGQAYLAAFMYRCQMSISTKKILTAILNGTIDDWAAYNPSIKEKSDRIFKSIHTVAKQYEKSWNEVQNMNFNTKKDLVLYCKDNYPNEANYIFKKFENPNLTGIDYILNLTRPAILRLIEEADKYV